MSLRTSAEDGKAEATSSWERSLVLNMGFPAINQMSVHQHLLTHCQRHDHFYIVMEVLP